MTGSEAPVRVSSDEQREQLMVQAAKLYFDLERTQSEIGRELGLTRWQVSRLLRDARETGIVRIEIVPRSQRRPDLESRLQERFGLREAIVVPAGGAAEDAIALDAVAQAAGQYLAALNPKPRLFGVSWGRTMAAVAHWLPPHWNDGVHVVLLNGATNIRSTGVRTNMVAERFAETGGGTATLLPVPAIVGRRETARVLERDPIIAGVLELAAQAPVACFGIGALGKSSVLVESGYLDPREIDALAAAGAVGDVLAHFVDAEGAIVDPEIDARTIGLTLDLLREKERSIGVAAGAAKHATVLACLKARLVNVLVTDAPTALYALEQSRRGPPGG